MSALKHQIPPNSVAGVLLREHDSVDQAIRYAERKARLLALMGIATGLDYAEAADALKRAFYK